jgi:DNA-binding GntR family transcriptional regulator
MHEETWMAGVKLPVEISPIDRHGSLGERAYEALKDRIIRGGFAPDTKLTVRSVALALGVSTTPARDAINRLIGEGALINAGPKTVVVPTLTAASLEEATVIRLALEGVAAEKAGTLITDAQIEELEQAQERINAALDGSRYTEVLDANKDFHFLIYRAAGMPRLLAMIETMWLRVGPAFHALYPEFAQTRQGVANHQAAMRGLRDRDSATVRAAIENDIRSGYRRLLSHLAKR